MSSYGYLSSLKDKEFLIMRQLCEDSISQHEKEKLQVELEKIRSEIKKLN
ncbi:MAG: hypothetical protein ACR2LL_01730 [Nitrosopumilus sp.]